MTNGPSRIISIPMRRMFANGCAYSYSTVLIDQVLLPGEVQNYPGQTGLVLEKILRIRATAIETDLSYSYLNDQMSNDSRLQSLY